jgi:uncharacterized membrane protein
MKKRNKKIIRILDLLAIICFIATFTPLVTPEQKSHPFLLGIPFTMWMGLIVSILFVVLTYFVSLINKQDNNAD